VTLTDLKEEFQLSPLVVISASGSFEHSTNVQSQTEPSNFVPDLMDQTEPSNISLQRLQETFRNFRCHFSESEPRQGSQRVSSEGVAAQLMSVPVGT
jgi:hypothetical protein